MQVRQDGVRTMGNFERPIPLPGSVCHCCGKVLATCKIVIVWDSELYCSMDCAEKMSKQEDLYRFIEEINPADIGECGCYKCGKILEDDYTLTRTDEGNVCADCMEEQHE